MDGDTEATKSSRVNFLRKPTQSGGGGVYGLAGLVRDQLLTPVTEGRIRIGFGVRSVGWAWA